MAKQVTPPVEPEEESAKAEQASCETCKGRGLASPHKLCADCNGSGSAEA